MFGNPRAGCDTVIPQQNFSNSFTARTLPCPPQLQTGWTAPNFAVVLSTDTSQCHSPTLRTSPVSNGHCCPRGVGGVSNPFPTAPAAGAPCLRRPSGTPILHFTVTSGTDISDVLQTTLFKQERCCLQSRAGTAASRETLSATKPQSRQP